MIAWGLTYLAHSSLLIAAVWLASRFVRSASARETLWKIALVAPILTASVPLRDVTPVRITLPAEVRGAAGSQPAEENITIRRAESAPLHKSINPMLAIWITGATLLLLRLLIGRLLFLRALRDRVELLREHDRLARLRAEMSCRPLVRLTESSAVGSPIAMPGWEIVVPRETFARLSDEQKETILAHELAHLLRRDPLWLLAGELIKALLFVQPLNWIAQKKMKECAEFLCDDLAVRHTSNPRALAETLAELATSVAPAPRAVAAMAEGGSNLMARVARVLTARRERPLRLVTRVAIAIITMTALAAFAPGIERSYAAANRKLMTWDATVHLTGSRDGLRTEIRVKANNVRYDDATAEVFFDGNASLYVEATVGNHTRTFRRNARELVWSGDFGKTEASAWLADLLHEQTELRADVARNLGRE